MINQANLDFLTLAVQAGDCSASVQDDLLRTLQFAKRAEEVLLEVAAEPYADSDPASLLATLRKRARWALGEVGDE